MKIYRIFAVFKTKRTKHIISACGIFYTHLVACILQKYKAVQIPVATAEMCWFSWSRMGGGQPFFYDKFSLTMTKRNENASRVNNSNTTSTFTHETGTFLTADNIERLKNLFSTPENYAKNLGALWVFRDLLSIAIDNDKNPCENQLFPLWQTINYVVGSLLRQDVHFDDNGRAYYYQGTTKMFI